MSKKNKEEVYKFDDLILPMLDLGEKVRIRIEITKDDVFLYIGPRDWQFERKTGEMVGCGTMIG
jgi:hypothetical protein